ncbi:MAG: lycopene cyclase domain-containing protein [Chloracidobacterium sp.]|uniref:Lycopene cyclase domain-containing protein n=1 Tax=Chloracidobacterium validum TaxID=2821543 RepID=A0ABX8B9T6_9BACT|nr:lycopene cyclase domain-containing protein [Chloracidobacterium validum]QUW02413.1 lycopene cyclase domain-containing protein [Chloracidobacterium validum]
MKTNYLFHLLGWMLPIVILQWVIGWRILTRNARAVFVPVIAVGLYFIVADSLAIAEGIWLFDANQILGIHLGIVPLEEVIFFFLTSLLVSQSLVLFLPKELRA